MPDNLYQVRLVNYKNFYVFASGWDEAAEKAKERIQDLKTDIVVSPDGSLTNSDGYDIKGIDLLTNDLIY